VAEIFKEILYLREKALQFRKLSLEHGTAGQNVIAAKLIEVAEDLEARASELAAKRASGAI
jgi:hypothetical protein